MSYKNKNKYEATLKGDQIEGVMIESQEKWKSLEVKNQILNAPINKKRIERGRH